MLMESMQFHVLGGVSGVTKGNGTNKRASYMPNLRTAFLLFAIFVVVELATSAPVALAQPDSAARDRIYSQCLHFSSSVRGGAVRAHWMPEGSAFWYADGPPDDVVIYQVKPDGSRSSLFDVARLRHSLLPFLERDLPARGLPFQDFSFVGNNPVDFTVGDRRFTLDLTTYEVTTQPAAPSYEALGEFHNFIGQALPEVLSPDRKRVMSVRDGNLWLRSSPDGREKAITSDAEPDYSWDGYRAAWSPNSALLAVTKVDRRGVEKVPLVGWLSAVQSVDWAMFPRAGGRLFRTELYVVNVTSGLAVRIDTGEVEDHYVVILGWRGDGSELLFFRADREMKRLDLLAADPANGKTRVVLSETAKTFVEGGPYDDRWLTNFTLLKDGARFIWRSERDGWDHLYLYDLNGTLLRRLTEGSFPVARVVFVDEAQGWVYLTAHPRSRPYDIQLYRVPLSGGSLAQLTDADGQHEIQFAPSGNYFLDTHSTVDRPPVTELRTPEGKLISIVSKADTGFLRDLQWRPPEEFAVKAADGKTDLYGVLYKPFDFDPAKRYPVIDYIYAGPSEDVVPHTFNSDEFDQVLALAQMGFVVFAVDGRGTPDRGKEFRDTVYGNVGRYEIPDHVATLKQLAAKRPYIDLSRVGIYGLSWGGYMTTRAMLMAPETYKVGIASSPPSDFRQLAMLTIETYMGMPQHNKEGYDYGSNLRLVDQLRGKLLLIHGTSDVSAPFSHTMQMVDALIKANKTFDLLVLPEQPHVYTGYANDYWIDAIRRYFVVNLLPNSSQAHSNPRSNGEQ